MNKKNIISLSLIKILKNVISIFVGSFLVLYFFKLSKENIIPLAIYYISISTLIYIIMYLIKDYMKGRSKLLIFRLSLIVSVLYFILIIVLKEKIIDYIWLLGIIKGIEEAFYYFTLNLFESSKIDNKIRKKFIGYNDAINSIVSVLLPVLLGIILSYFNYYYVAVILLFVLFITFIATYYIEDNEEYLNGKCDIESYNKQVNKNKNVKKIYKITTLIGIVASGGGSLITLYIMTIFNTNLKLGILTSIFAGVKILTSFIFGKLKNKNITKNILAISGMLYIISLALIILYPTYLTIIIYQILDSSSYKLLNLLIGKNQMDISNIEEIKDKYRVEYFIVKEKYLFYGRTIGFLIFLLIGIVNKKYFLVLMLIIVVLFTIETYKEVYNIEE